MKREVSVSLVTGASSGLGRDIASLLCDKGHLVYVVARRREKLLELQKECAARKKGEIRVIVGDLTKANFREKLIKQILRQTKRIDYLINNAGYGKLINFENEELEDIEGMFQLNIIAQEHLTQLVLPSMKKRKRGKLINISSVVVFSPLVYFTTYNATKSAIYNFSKTLSYELAGTGVYISVVLPSRMKTPLWRRAFECKGITKEEQEKCREKWTKQAVSSEKIARYVVRKLDSRRLILLPDLFSKIAYYFLRHFYFIGDFFAKHFILPKTRKLLQGR